jgi:hypothetical protein
MFRFLLAINVCNNFSTEEFPGGNITGAITPPSGDRYRTPLEISVPSLKIGDCRLIGIGFKPEESGVYTVSLNIVKTLAFYNPVWEVSGGFLALTIEPVSTMIGLWSLIVALALGVLSIVVSVVPPIIQERRKQRNLVNRQRKKAYARLYAILERHGVNASTTKMNLSNEDFRELQSAVEDNFDVLDASTLDEWRNRKVARIERIPAVAFTVEAGRFFDNILNHYARFDRRNPYHDSENQ